MFRDDAMSMIASWRRRSANDSCCVLSCTTLQCSCCDTSLRTTAALLLVVIRTSQLSHRGAVSGGNFKRKVSETSLIVFFSSFPGALVSKTVKSSPQVQSCLLFLFLAPSTCYCQCTPGLGQHVAALCCCSLTSHCQ